MVPNSFFICLACQVRRVTTYAGVFQIIGERHGLDIQFFISVNRPVAKINLKPEWLFSLILVCYS